MLLPLIDILLQIMRLPDGGPVYSETDLSRLIVEPWNAVSAAFFLGIVLYWYSKLHNSKKRNSFLRYSLPILAIGGVGGTLYHAFRSSHYFLIMDYLPILLICISAGIYFTFKAFPKKRSLLIAASVFVLAQYLTFKFVPDGLSTNISYALLALSILFPTSLWMWRTQFRYYYYVLFALLSFAAALFCRIADFWETPFLPMGTHWLWHTFGALACHLMFLYLFSVNQETEVPDEDDIEKKPNESHENPEFGGEQTSNGSRERGR
jgi:hypothetical protein